MHTAELEWKQSARYDIIVHSIVATWLDNGVYSSTGSCGETRTVEDTPSTTMKQHYGYSTRFMCRLTEYRYSKAQADR